MSDSDRKRERAGRGEATARIVAALANESPRVHGRQSFLNSESLARQFGKAALSEAEKNSVSKTLGRLIANNTVGEILYLRQTTGFAGEGLVGVSVSLTSLHDRHEKWRKDCDKKNEDRQIREEPTQEWIAREILRGSKAWVDKKRREQENQQSLKSGDEASVMDPYAAIPLIVRDINIVHGSGSFDLLVSVRYRHPDIFLEYVRKVVQKVPCVESTQTMQIASSEGLLHFEDHRTDTV